MNKLKIENLEVSIDNKIILKDFNLTISSGEIHILMGPNGVGKSTLTKVIMGDPNYKVTKGTISYNDKVINDLSVDERARMGIFLGMQLPMEIEGVTNADFLRTAVSLKEKENFKLYSFIKKLENKVNDLKIDNSMIHRDVNKGFSGGERKKNEIIQMYMLNPSFIMLDEIDSGLDVDSLKVVANEINNYIKENNPLVLLITHYHMILDYIKPTHVHIIKNGKIIKTGGYELVDEIEKDGFDNIEEKKVNSIGTCAIKEKLKHE